MNFPITNAPLINAPANAVTSPFTISGTASPYAKIQAFAPGGAVRYDDDDVYADAAGNWSITDVTRTDGTYAVIAQQLLNGKSSRWTDEVHYTVQPAAAAFPITNAPLINAPTNAVTSPFTISGTATPHAKIQVYTPGGAARYDDDNVYADAAGNWSIADVARTDGAYAVVAQQSLNGQSSPWTDEVYYTVQPAAASFPITNAPLVNAPAHAVISPFTISGTATPHAKIQVYTPGGAARYDDDNVYADAAGNWSIADVARTDGTYAVVAQQSLNGQSSPWTDEVHYTVQPAAMAFPITNAPLINAPANNVTSPFTISGTATPHAKIRAFAPGGAVRYDEDDVYVDATNNWSIANVARPDGTYAVIAQQVLKGQSSPWTDNVHYTVQPETATTLKITSPQSEVGTSRKPIISGTCVPSNGYDNLRNLEVIDAGGTRIARTTLMPNQKTWAINVDFPLPIGKHTVFAREGTPKRWDYSSDSVTFNVVSSEWESLPALFSNRNLETEGVNPLTGQFYTSLPIASLVGNAGRGPALDFELFYSAERFIDFGSWAFNLTYCRVSKEKNSCTGELFIGNESKKIELTLDISSTDINVATYTAHQKITPLSFNDLSKGLKIVRSDGTTEILTPFRSNSTTIDNRDYFYLVPQKILTKLGFALTLSWEMHNVSTNYYAPRLTTVADEQQTLFMINYIADSVSIEVFGGSGRNQSHVLEIKDNQLTEIRLSTDETQPFKKTFTYSTTPGTGTPDTFKLMSIIDSCGLTTELTYAKANRVTVKKDSIPTDISSTTTYHYEYTPNPRTTVQTVAEQVKTSIFEYDENYALKSITTNFNSNSENTILTLFKNTEEALETSIYHMSATGLSPEIKSTLTFDKNGNLSSRTENNITTDYTYYRGDPKVDTSRRPAGKYEVGFDPPADSGWTEKVFGWVGHKINWAIDNLTLYGLIQQAVGEFGFTWSRLYEIEDILSPQKDDIQQKYKLPVPIGTDGDPNYFNSYLESERSYQIINGARVDLQWTFYAYRSYAVKTNEITDRALLPYQKLTILRPITQDFISLSQYQEASMFLETALYGEDPSDNAGFGKLVSASKHALNAGGQIIPSTEQRTMFSYSLYNDQLTTYQETTSGEITQTTQSITSTTTGKLLNAIDVLGNKTEYHYDSLNRLTAQIDFAQDAQLRRETRYIHEFNGAGHTVQTIYPDNEQVREAYDALDRLIYTETWHAPTSTWKRLTDIGYNLQDQETSIREYDYAPDGALLIDRLVKLTYDDWGNPLSRETVGAGIQYAQISLKDQTLTQWRKYPDGSSSGIVTSSYNTFGKVGKISFKTPQGSEYKSCTYTYDAFGYISEEIPSDNPTIKYGYDARGRMTSSTCNDMIIRSGYTPTIISSVATDISVTTPSDGAIYKLGKRQIDGLERVTDIYTGGRSLSVFYNGSSPIGYTSSQPPLSSSFIITSSYDATTGTLTEFNTPSNNVHAAFREPKTATYTHSLRGAILSEADIYGNLTEHYYDNFGRLSQSTSSKVERKLIYDSAQRLKEEYVTDNSQNTTMQTTYTYDDQDRETQRIFKVNDSTLLISQTYDKEGRLDKTSVILNNNLLRQEVFTYDLNKRLYSYVCTGPVRPTDAHNNLLTAQDFHYNALGGITEYTSYSDTGNVKYTYEYSTADGTQLRTINTPNSTTNLDYDSLGQQIKDQQGATCNYDAAGNLINRVQPQQQYTYLYDSLGRQSACEGSDYYERYFYNGQYQYARQGQFHDNNVLYSRTSILLNRSAACRLMEQELKPDGGTSEFSSSFEILDARGNLLASYDPLNQSFTHFAYTPFGYRHDNWKNRSWLGFNGEPLDRTSGLYHLGNGARSYSTISHCFLTHDESSPFEEGGINGYVYCGNDPINFSDPTGQAEVARKYLIMPHQPLIYNQVAQAILMGGIGVALAPFTGGGSMGVAAAMTGLAAVSAGFGIAAAATSDSNPELSTVFDALSIGTGLITPGKFAGAARGAIYKGMPKVMARSSTRGIVTMGGTMRELEQIGNEIHTFVDRYKGLDRLNIAAHGLDLNKGERLLDVPSCIVFNNAKLFADDLLKLLRSKNIDPSKYANVRLLVCFSANGGVDSFAANFQRLIKRNIKAFEGPVSMNHSSTSMTEKMFKKFPADQIRELYAKEITHKVYKTNPYSPNTLEHSNFRYKPHYFPKK